MRLAVFRPYVRPDEPLTADARGDFEEALRIAPARAIVDGITEGWRLTG